MLPRWVRRRERRRGLWAASARRRRQRRSRIDPSRALADIQPRLFHLGRAAGRAGRGVRPAARPRLLAQVARGYPRLGRADRRVQRQGRLRRRLLTPDYAELRRRTQERDRSLREKVMSLEEAAALVSDGASVGVGGSTLSRTPMAMIWALIRANRKDLRCARSITSSEGELLLASGASRHLLTSWFSLGIVWGVSRIMRLYTEAGRARFEEWSHLAVGLRFRAGAMGVPFLPMRSMLGSDVIAQLPDVRQIECPFTGEKLVVVPALNPEFALIHVQRCDAYGNAQIDGLPFMDLDLAMAANRVILTTERIVSNDQIRRAPDQTKIPFMAVDAVVEAPFGCAPHECYGLYEPLFKHLDRYALQVKADPEEGIRAYLEHYVYGPESWTEYLDRLGITELLDARRRGTGIYDD